MRGGKDVENRSRNIAGAYRGPVIIHAGLAKFEQDNMSSTAHRAAHGGEVQTDLTFGAALGTVDLIGVHENRPDFGCEFTPRLCSTWAQPGEWRGGVGYEMYHLVLANPRPFPKPIPYRGALGLWQFPDELLPKGWLA